LKPEIFSGELCKMYWLVGCNVIEDWQKLPAFRFPISDTGIYCLHRHLENGTDVHLSYLVNTGAFPNLMCPEPKADSPPLLST
jgi:hypothetical protein